MSSAGFSCRNCDTPLGRPFLDLGSMPLANSYVSTAGEEERHFPLQAHVCERCWLMQVPPLADPESVFSDYAYFSSFSSIWRAHCDALAAKMAGRLRLGADSLVVEIASNDGYLLRQFQSHGAQVLGIEPAQNIAAYANRLGVPTESRFFHKRTAEELVRNGVSADLIVANNVLAHVPDIHGFVAGFAPLLKPQGRVSFEFPHVLELLRGAQFDTIYHEHFSYLSLGVVEPLLRQHGLKVVEVEYLTTHGGSLRVLAAHAAAEEAPDGSVAACLRHEREAGLSEGQPYRMLAARAEAIRQELLQALREAGRAGRRVAAYGAPAKGNTLLNYCGITPELVAYTVDANPEKQGRFLPGSGLPVHAPDYLLADRPDVVVILPWNIAGEVMEAMAPVRAWGGRFLRAIPHVEYV